MAINNLAIPTAGAVSSFDFQSPLAALAQQFKQQQEQAVIKDTLARATNGGQIDPAALIGSGNLTLANMGMQYQNKQQEQARLAQQDARQASRDAATDRYQAATLGLQKRAQDRLDASASETPEIKAGQRAAIARNYGIDPVSPEGRKYILTGELPTTSATTPTGLLKERETAAAAAGMKPDNPGYQSYLLTGKMPREDAQPLTATDKKAIIEADELVQSNQAAIDSLGRAKGLSKQAFSGPLAAQRGYAASLLGGTSDFGKSGIATESLRNEVESNALSQLKAIFGGAPTEGERKILLDIQGSASKSPEVREAIYDRAMAAANKRLEFNRQRAEGLRGNTYYKPGQNQSQNPPRTDASAPISKATYDALPSGAQFTAPDGSIRVKP